MDERARRLVQSVRGRRKHHPPANGRTIRILSVVDVFTRECLVLEADISGEAVA
jgi:hypothetical protein